VTTAVPLLNIHGISSKMASESRKGFLQQVQSLNNSRGVASTRLHLSVIV
jgi:hypothetical protein